MACNANKTSGDVLHVVMTMALSTHLLSSGKTSELTLVHPIKADQADTLRTVLTHLQPQDLTALQAQRTIHTVRWVMFDNDTRLLFTSHFEGTAEAFLEDFATHGATCVERIWGNCIGYPAGNSPHAEAIVAYLAAGQVSTTAFLRM